MLVLKLKQITQIIKNLGNITQNVKIYTQLLRVSKIKAI